MTKQQSERDRTAEKLDIVVGLLQEIKEALTKTQSIREKVSHFSNENRNLTNKDISRILGISEKHVSKEKSLLKLKDSKQDERE